MYALCDRIFSVSIFIGNKKTLNNIRYTGHQYLQTTEKVSSYTNHSLFIDPRIGPESLAKVAFRSIRNNVSVSFICAHW